MERPPANTGNEGLCCKLTAELSTCKAAWVAAVPLLHFNPAGAYLSTVEILTSNINSTCFVSAKMKTRKTLLQGVPGTLEACRGQKLPLLIPLTGKNKKINKGKKSIILLSASLIFYLRLGKQALCLCPHSLVDCKLCERIPQMKFQRVISAKN